MTASPVEGTVAETISILNYRERLRMARTRITYWTGIAECPHCECYYCGRNRNVSLKRHIQRRHPEEARA